MKVLFCLLLLFIFSCSTPPNQPTTATLVENYVKNQMKDPSSFQLISNQLVDTTMMNKWLSDQYSKDTAMVTQTIADNKLDMLAQNFAADETDAKNGRQNILDEKTNMYRQYAIKDSMEISKHKPDRIFYISYMVSYRAKNGFGALDVGNSTVNFYPADSTFKMVTQ